jgi:hypothetical protein
VFHIHSDDRGATPDIQDRGLGSEVQSVTEATNGR